MSTKASFWSRLRGPLLLGAAACAACCAAPLAAIVVGAGAASTLAAIAEPIAGGLLAGAAVLGIAIYARHRRARAAAAACAIDGSCGCGPRETSTLYSSPEPAAESPVACTADLGNQRAVQAGIDEYRRAFLQAESTERTEDGFRWRFRNAPGLQARLQRLARAEHACCNFMKFDVTARGNEIVWEVRADARAQSVIEEYMRMPERLREEVHPGHDIARRRSRAATSPPPVAHHDPRRVAHRRARLRRPRGRGRAVRAGGSRRGCDGCVDPRRGSGKLANILGYNGNA